MPTYTNKKKPADRTMVHNMPTRSILQLDDGRELYLEHDEHKYYRAGGMGMVKKGMSAAGKKYAVKILSRKPLIQTSDQYKALQSINYPRDINFARRAVEGNRLLGREAFLFERGKKIYYITEWIDGDLLEGSGNGEIDPKFLNLPFETRFKMAIALLNQIQQLHVKKHIHGDIKLANVMFNSKGEIFVIDLDTVRIPKTPGVYSYSVDYLDKRLFAFYCSDISPSDNQDFCDDVYACGMTLIAMLPELGRFYAPPTDAYYAMNDERYRIQTEVYSNSRGTIPDKFKDQAEKLRQQLPLMLSQDGSKRPTIEWCLAQLDMQSTINNEQSKSRGTAGKQAVQEDVKQHNTEKSKEKLHESKMTPQDHIKQEILPILAELHKEYSEKKTMHHNRKLNILRMQILITAVHKIPQSKTVEEIIDQLTTLLVANIEAVKRCARFNKSNYGSFHEKIFNTQCARDYHLAEKVLEKYNSNKSEKDKIKLEGITKSIKSDTVPRHAKKSV